LIKKYPIYKGSADDDEDLPNEPTTPTPSNDGCVAVPVLTPDPSILTADKSAVSSTHTVHPSDPLAALPDTPADDVSQPDGDPTHS